MLVAARYDGYEVGYEVTVIDLTQCGIYSYVLTQSEDRSDVAICAALMAAPQSAWGRVTWDSVTDPTDELTLEIMRSLEIDRQWVRRFDPVDFDGIAKARSAGRRAGRALGVKIVTRQSDPARRKDGQVVVIVVVDQDETDPEEAKRLEERHRMLMDEFL